MQKKTHLGKHGKPKCVTRLSAHVRHSPARVVEIDAFKKLPEDQRCQKCAKSIDTSHFAAELGTLILGH